MDWKLIPKIENELIELRDKEAILRFFANNNIVTNEDKMESLRLAMGVKTSEVYYDSDDSDPYSDAKLEFELAIFLGKTWRRLKKGI